MRRIALILALVVTLGMWGMVSPDPASASASRSALPTAVSHAESQESVGTLAICTLNAPPAGWKAGTIFGGGWSIACNKCRAEGRVIELGGKFLVTCFYRPGGFNVQMYTFCRACRDGSTAGVPGKL